MPRRSWRGAGVFLLLLNVAAPPFAIEPGPLAENGFGLNPLLQYPEMVIHPPMLYLGYVGFAVPFAFALGALMMRYPGEKWIAITRRWTMVTWMFLTCGIFLGAHWAYSVLGWGGYWGWDPVENASLMPWLTGTAFLHSVMMQEKRGMMKSWNVWLIFTTFLLTLLGTLLTRAGLVSSVHAFAQSSIGTWFVVVHGDRAGGVPVHVLQAARPPEDREPAGVAGEPRVELPVQQHGVAGGLLYGALGHAVPGAERVCAGHEGTMGAPFYNRVNLPIGLFLLLLTGVGPLLAWRSTSLRTIRGTSCCRGSRWRCRGGLMLGGMRPWKAGDDWQAVFFSLLAFSLAAG